MEDQPLLVVRINGIPYVMECVEPLDFEQYQAVRKIAEDATIYAMNAHCINPDVLAYQFIKYVGEDLHIHLVVRKTWPAMILKTNRN